ncbi:hypothetical protein ASE35_16040 [Lysobacter sp. Root916]|uniref:hypothetical protein n=1 Tax=Lysobacter sp. Root916 TaxID=1736606 RepID=UPI000708D82E|nr:hypothetical protein [Lysobacter sp. Root916]KRD31505.1 hypothetical protein ASE35_16040 [Lysobacter sp. Root916]
MGIEYKIRFEVPPRYDHSAVAGRLPTAADAAGAIYGYELEADGYYFIDHLVDPAIAAVAFRRLVDEALRHSDLVQILEP